MTIEDLKEELDLTKSHSSIYINSILLLEMFKEQFQTKLKDKNSEEALKLMSELKTFSSNVKSMLSTNNQPFNLVDLQNLSASLIEAIELLSYLVEKEYDYFVANKINLGLDPKAFELVISGRKRWIPNKKGQVIPPNEPGIPQPAPMPNSTEMLELGLKESDKMIESSGELLVHALKGLRKKETYNRIKELEDKTKNHIESLARLKDDLSYLYDRLEMDSK